MKTHELLKRYVEKNRKTQPGFSVRALARRVGVSAPFLSRVLAGKKPIPDALFDKLSAALRIEPELFEKKPRPGRRKKVPPAIPAALSSWEIADAPADRVLRAWYYLPILELTTLADFNGGAAEVAARLGLPAADAEAALSELVALGLLQGGEGDYRKAKEKIRFTGARTLNHVRIFHAAMLDRAKQELLNAQAEADRARRLISGITVTAAPEAVEEAKQKLNECLHQIANDLAARPGTEVYHLAVQLFPLTKKR